MEFARSDSRKWLVAGAVALTLACLLKLPAVFLGPAIVAALVLGRGWTVFRDPRVWIAGIVPLGADGGLVLARAHRSSSGPA